MSDWVSAVHPGILTTELPGLNAGPVQEPLWTGLVPTAILGAGDLASDAVATIFNDWLSAKAADPGVYWFDHIHYTPEAIELGNMISTVVQDIHIYSAYKLVECELSLAEANAGDGVMLEDVPLLPYMLGTQTGLTIKVRITVEGPPAIDGTLDFETDVLVFSIPITGSRVVMFPYMPESPIEELLEWKTDVLRNRYGEEQRIALRASPRQFFKYDFRVEIDDDRRRMQVLLFGWHPRVFGLPVWHEARYLKQPVSEGESSVAADASWGDFRVGGLAIVWSGPSHFDALQVASVSANGLTFESPVTADHGRDALLMPLRTAYTESAINVERWLNNLEDLRLIFRVLDNETDIASTGGWSEHNGKVMMDDPNLVQGQTLPDSLSVEVEIIDNDTGVPIQQADWLQARNVTRKSWLCRDPETAWGVRRLLHALRGRQVAFYLPTFFEDLVVVSPIAQASDLLDIANIGYADYINGREPNKSIRILLHDGTVITRQVESAVAVSNEVERLTVDVPWSSDVQVEDIKMVSFLRRCRLLEDRVKLVHDNTGRTVVEADVIGVQL